MALDGILLSKIIPETAAVLPGRIQKIHAVSRTEILFSLHGPKGKARLLVSCHSLYNRILLTDRSYPSPAAPGNFVMVLRKYLEGATMTNIRQADLDRWCTIDVRRRNALGDMETVKIVIELMGKYANLILVGSDGVIIDALKKIPPFQNNRRIIQPGAMFVPTPPQGKKDPFQCESFDPSLSLTKQFSGFSPFLEKEVLFRLSRGESFAAIMREMQNSSSLFIAKTAKEPVFHCIELKHVGPCVRYPLFAGFDYLFFHKEEKDRVKQSVGDIDHLIRRHLKHQKTKLPRLLEALDEACDAAKWKTYGDLLYTHNIKDTKGLKQIVLTDYVSGEEIAVPLDEKLDGSANARKAYQKYQKLKKGKRYTEEQIAICKAEIAYFEGLSQQLDQADYQTALQIREELMRQGYLKEKRKTAKTKNQPVRFTTFTAPSGISVSYGRNNLQNDLLTWHFARKNEIWLHAKDYHGGHVVIHDEHPDEETLRLSANVAAYFSKGRSSSSVPVIYCPVKNLKKIPGAKPGTVSLGSYKTIYIDPDEDLLVSSGVELP